MVDVESVCDVQRHDFDSALTRHLLAVARGRNAAHLDAAGDQRADERAGGVAGAKPMV